MQPHTLIETFTQARCPAVLLDFDGVLSNIVDHPEDAAPVAGVEEALDRLAGRADTVAVISGRPVEFLVSALGDVSGRLRLFGNSGLQSREGGRTTVRPEVARHYDAMRDAFARARSLVPSDIQLEDKDVAFALHYRTRPELEDAAHRLGEKLAAEAGLRATTGKMHVEVRLPVEVSKGDAVRSVITERHDWAMFAGDDNVDVPAFETLTELDLPWSFRVAVEAGNTAEELMSRADLVVSSPAEFVAFLDALADARVQQSHDDR